MSDTSEKQETFIPTNIDGGKPEITMAPLIDVVFLLLIFFMVTTVFPENKGLIISKPASENTKQLAPKQLTFLINDKNQIFFRQNKVNIRDIKRIIEEEIMQKPEISVLLKVDKLATTETFIKVMDACKSGGAQSIGIATEALNKTL